MPINFNQNGRYERRSKRRKTNLILNTLIAIVIILILIVGGKTFFGGDKKQQTANTEQSDKANNSSKEKDIEQETPVNKPDNNRLPAEGNNSNDDLTKDEEDDHEEMVDQEIIEQKSSEENVEKEIINPAWKPIGTEQTSGHESSYEKGTIDWNEKLSAASYAVNIPVDQMILWWISAGGNPENQSILTVTDRVNTDEAYRVYIEWVNGEGWKPNKVQKLIENDKKKSSDEE